MSFVELQNLVKRYGASPVVRGVNLQARKGEMVVLVGPSGCGKSTVLRMIAGLEEVSEGQVLIDGRDVTHASPGDREVAMVFQTYALYPHMTVAENIAFSLKLAKAPAAHIRERIAEAARILKLEPLLGRRPKQLSGGQRQRVAIGRAIVRHPKVFLFDEPLSNLDAELRAEMRVEIAKLHRDLGVTMIYVTHDQVEAMTLADRIVVMRDGRIEQTGTPTEIYDRPTNRFVAGFIGSPKMNFLNGALAAQTEHSLTIAHESFVGGQLVVERTPRRPLALGEPVTVGLRPDAVAIDGSRPALIVTADFAEVLGGQTQIYANAPSVPSFSILTNGRPAITEGEALPLRVDPAALHLFDAEGASV